MVSRGAGDAAIGVPRRGGKRARRRPRADAGHRRSTSRRAIEARAPNRLAFPPHRRDLSDRGASAHTRSSPSPPNERTPSSLARSSSATRSRLSSSLSWPNISSECSASGTTTSTARSSSTSSPGVVIQELVERSLELRCRSISLRSSRLRQLRVLIATQNCATALPTASRVAFLGFVFAGGAACRVWGDDSEVDVEPVLLGGRKGAFVVGHGPFLAVGLLGRAGNTR